MLVDTLIRANAQRWTRARMNRDFSGVAQRLIAAKKRYQLVYTRTGVPWWAVAVIHEREASQNWNTQLGQGDPLDRISTHVPKGRGPFRAWEDGAYDALVDCPPYASAWKDWTAGGVLTLLEKYNGLGYADRNMPSPYIWSGTNQYVKGKYVRDGVFDPNVVDEQLGCAGLLMAMRKIDKTITFADEKPIPEPLPPPPDIPAPEHVPHPAPQPATSGFFSVLLNFIINLFRRK